MKEERRGTRRECGSERADALSLITSDVVQGASTQSSVCTEAGGLLSLFLRPGFLSPWPGLLEPWSLRRRKTTSGSLWRCDRFHHRTSRDCCRTDVVVPAG